MEYLLFSLAMIDQDVAELVLRDGCYETGDRDEGIDDDEYSSAA